MHRNDLVLIDTCVWIPYFNRPQSRQKQAIDELLDDDRVAIIGPVLAEILLGFRRDSEADWVASKLRGVHLLEVEWDEWRHAARLGREAASTGVQVPLTDLILAAVALNRGLAVSTTDPHSDRFDQLQRLQV